MVHIVMDMRERDLIPKIESIFSEKTPNKITYASQNLPLGDIVIYEKKQEPGEEMQELVIIERKTVSDLMASIKDGRYDEQSYRLSGYEHCHNHNIYYLIEGPARLKNNAERGIYQSALFSISYYKGFSVMHSTSIDDTAFIVCNLANKIQRELISRKKTPYYQIQSQTQIVSLKQNVETNENQVEMNNTFCENIQSDNYCSVVKKVKKDNITGENITAIMLSQIPGVSALTANAICQKYKTMFELVFAVQETPNCLDDICTTDSNNKTRKISKTVRSKIIDYLSE
jgi:ERCC4-type nuclease